MCWPKRSARLLPSSAFYPAGHSADAAASPQPEKASERKRDAILRHLLPQRRPRFTPKDYEDMQKIPMDAIHASIHREARTPRRNKTFLSEPSGRPGASAFHLA
eukprot:TRINITY_DN16544_c0_g1_i2.p3 TRINITY_DN16544_c0_g1~~TRINITY_DN16544_c0_g1_i2.p3  ORF type:complete len:121 (+),score=11.96 TRINITY_DN16544_c0_g1_i2:53-364(+)